ncbi:MAG: hypothetical protein U5N53_17530 [Mycobacterium sp.]|nr:hypothetical protein [Mycobacterium sp.]
MSVDIDTAADPELSDPPEITPEESVELPSSRPRRSRFTQALIFGVMPAVAVVLALGVGYLKWQTGSAQQAESAAAASVAAATDTTIAILAYQSDTVDRDLHAATDRLTGTFRDEYTKLIDEVVIPGAKEKRVSASVTIPAAASVSAGENRAEVLVFVNQETKFGDDTPSNSVSSVKVTLQKEDDRWLVSQFEPV